MTPLSDLERLAKQATPGRWYAVNLQTHLGMENEHIADWAVTDERNRIVQMICPPRPANAAFIAACDPQTVLALIEVARSAVDAIERAAQESDYCYACDRHPSQYQGVHAMTCLVTALDALTRSAT